MGYTCAPFRARRETHVPRALRFRPFLRPMRDPRIAQLEHPTDGAHLLLARNPVSRKLRFGHFLRPARDSRLAWVTFQAFFATGERSATSRSEPCAFHGRVALLTWEGGHPPWGVLPPSSALGRAYYWGGPPALHGTVGLTWGRPPYMGPSAFRAGETSALREENLCGRTLAAKSSRPNPRGRTLAAEHSRTNTRGRTLTPIDGDDGHKQPAR